MNARRFARSALPRRVLPRERAFDPTPWLEDLAQLEDALGQHYANLEWNVRHRGVDPAALDRTAREQISRAASEREALVRFIAASGIHTLRGNGPDAELRPLPGGRV